MREQASSLAQQRAAGVGQLHPATRAVKQRHAELLFEPADLMTERWLGDVQPLSSPAEVKLLSDRDEVLHQPQV